MYGAVQQLLAPLKIWAEAHAFLVDVTVGGAIEPAVTQLPPEKCAAIPFIAGHFKKRMVCQKLPDHIFRITQPVWIR